MIKIVSMPFLEILDPSYDMASIIAYLNSKNIDTKGYYPCIEYIKHLGYGKFNELMTTGIGNRIFSSLLFQELTECHKNYIENTDFDFNELLSFTKSFTLEYIEKMSISDNDVIVFYMYTRQLLPSLYMAEKIKEKYSCKVWLAGFNCIIGLKESLMECFPYIDMAFSEDIEENLYAALSGEKMQYHDTLDFLPTPDYSDFIEELDSNKKELGFSSKNCYLQIEFTRGFRAEDSSCFNLLPQTSGGFRERSLDMIIKDYETLQNRYKTTLFLSQGSICSKEWRYIFSELYKRFPALHKAHRLILTAKDFQGEEDFKLLKKIGASVLVNTKSFSVSYLNKLNNKQKVIENIYVLKMAERWGVPCFHNLMYALPFEEERFFTESKNNISYILHLPPPFDDEEFRLTFGSDIYNHPENYGIKQIDYKDEYCLFPDKISNKLKQFFCDFKSVCDEEIEKRKPKWKKLIENWRKIYYAEEISGEPKRQSLLYKNDMNDFLQIVDFRYAFDTYELEGDERAIYNFCDSPKNIKAIIQYFDKIEKEKIIEILENFVLYKIMFKEDDYYLNLAI